MGEYEFMQILAEAKHYLGVDAVFEPLEACARRYGWPIPPEHREPTIRYVLTRLRDQLRAAGI